MGGTGRITVEIEVQAYEQDREHEALRLGINVPVDAETLGSAVPAALGRAALTAADRLGLPSHKLWAGVLFKSEDGGEHHVSGTAEACKALVQRLGDSQEAEG